LTQERKIQGVADSTAKVRLINQVKAELYEFPKWSLTGVTVLD
jgi:hypothetical protein